MLALETKVPPPVVALVLTSGMWLLAKAMPELPIPQAARLVAAAILAIVGVSLGLAGTVSFRRAKTTVNPLSPEKASTLVANGVYRFTRNPMYLGMLLGLVAVAVYLSSLWAMVGPVAFLVYMNRFQVTPEESVLQAKFGTAYLEYKQRVRRWL